MYVGPCKAIQKERAKRQRMLKKGRFGIRNIMPLSDSFLVIIFLSPVLLKWQNYSSIIYR